jgi:Ca-activated chloride channel family protein
MNGALNLWKERKKKSNVLLVLDISGSMKAERKMENAIAGSLQLIDILGEQDSFTFIPFNDKVSVAAKVPALGPEREKLRTFASSLFAGGGTALYDAVMAAQQSLAKDPSPDRINAIVVLSDGADESSVNTNLPNLLRSISATDEKDAGARVFTIGYGSGANAEVLEKIATASKGKYFKGTPENIREVFREISTFF